MPPTSSVPAASAHASPSGLGTTFAAGTVTVVGVGALGGKADDDLVIDGERTGGPLRPRPDGGDHPGELEPDGQRQLVRGRPPSPH